MNVENKNEEKVLEYSSNVCLVGGVLGQPTKQKDALMLYYML